MLRLTRIPPLLVLVLTGACARSDDDAAEHRAPVTAEKKAKAGDEFPDVPRGPVAIVGGTEISRAAFIKLYRQQVTRPGRDEPSDEMKLRFKQQTMARLVEEEQFRLEAARLGIVIDEAKINERVERGKFNIADWPAHMLTIGESEATIRSRSLAELHREALVDLRVDRNVTEEDVRKTYEEAKQAFTSEVERIRTSHLLVVVAPRTGSERATILPRTQREAAAPGDTKAWETAALARALELRQEALRPGVDFAELAKKKSEGPGAFRGGDMGYYDSRRMIPAYTAAAFALKVGEISQPVLTERGYFVIKMFDRQPPGAMPLEAVREDIATSIERRRVMEATNALKEELQRRHPVQMLLDLGQGK